MGAFVHVRHFLTPAGWEAFPRLFAEHQRRVARFPGFVTLRHSKWSASPPLTELEVILEFESEALLKVWRSSAEHTQVAAEYRPFWARDPEIRFSQHE
jgi:heme-degrading monooxygenase HmoA